MMMTAKVGRMKAMSQRQRTWRQREGVWDSQGKTLQIGQRGKKKKTSMPYPTLFRSYLFS